VVVAVVVAVACRLSEHRLGKKLRSQSSHFHPQVCPEPGNSFSKLREVAALRIIQGGEYPAAFLQEFFWSKGEFGSSLGHRDGKSADFSVWGGGGMLRGKGGGGWQAHGDARQTVSQ